MRFSADLGGRAPLVAAVAGGCVAAAWWMASKAPKRGGAADDDEILSLARPNILALAPYHCARDDYTEGVLLDANENAYGPVARCPGDADGSWAEAAPPAVEAELNRYPSPYQWELKELLAAHRGVRRENFFVGVGSDEAIDLLFRVFCEPRGDNCLITPPTYGMYKVCAAVNDVDVLKVGLTPAFDVDVGAVLAAVTPRTKLLFLCSPGNPTAKSIPLATIERLLNARECARALIVVDEAYADFATTESACPMVARYPRLVVLQTLSKAFGLAGARIGFACGDARLIQLLNNVKAPYNLNKLSSKLARKALSPAGLATLQRNVADTLAERARLAAALEALPFVRKVFVTARARARARPTTSLAAARSLSLGDGALTPPPPPPALSPGLPVGHQLPALRDRAARARAAPVQDHGRARRRHAV